jgi:hypothetical protein
LPNSDWHEPSLYITKSFHSCHWLNSVLLVPSNALCISDIVFLCSFIWCHYSPALCFTHDHLRGAWLSTIITWCSSTTATGTSFTPCGTVIILPRQVCHLHYILVLQKTKIMIRYTMMDLQFSDNTVYHSN